jgi:non-lysosomal glucosylceramidase
MAINRRRFLDQGIKGGFSAALGAVGLRTVSGAAAPSDKVVAKPEASVSSSAQEGLLDKFKFRNSGVITRKMQFRHFDIPVDYIETDDFWSSPWRNKLVPYLFEDQNGQRRTPPSGIRSAVPLGGLGSGTMEPRADGAIMDWNIFNNSPAQGRGGPKIQLPEALWGLRVRQTGLSPKAWTLRTHPPESLPAIEHIEYAGAFPVSRMKFSDAELPLAVELYSYCAFFMHQPKVSSTPAVLFSFFLHNPTRKGVEAELMFNLPNHFQSKVKMAERGLTLTTAGNLAESGSLALRLADSGIQANCLTAGDLQKQWTAFAETGGTAAPVPPESTPAQVGVAAGVNLAPGESRTVTFVLAWYFPHRPHLFGQVLANFYTTVYKHADDVAEQTIRRIPEILEAAWRWQRLCFDNSLPDWFQDALVNSVATSYKTGMYFAPGFFRQWEAFACPNDTPTHIWTYGCLPYLFFYPELGEGILRAFAGTQKPDGQICEDLSHESRLCADAMPVFNLGVYRHYLWTADRRFLDSMWPSVKNSARWSINRSRSFGAPNRVFSTYDEWGFHDYELTAYNVVLHLAGLRAAEAIAEVEGDGAFAQECATWIDTGQRTLNEKFWNGRYFRAVWNPDNSCPPEAILSDTLYGAVWTTVLGLPEIVQPEKMRSHLTWELKRLDSPYGLKIYSDMSDDDKYPSAGEPQRRPGVYGHNTIFQCASVDWATLSISLGEDLEAPLSQVQRVVDNWRDNLHDQWNWSDGSMAYDGFPLVNSHYARQLIFWAIPLAISGQQYSAPQKKLSFNPKAPPPAKLPWCTPQANGTLELLPGSRFRFTVCNGHIELDTLSVGKLRKQGPLSLSSGDTVELQ